MPFRSDGPGSVRESPGFSLTSPILLYTVSHRCEHVAGDGFVFP